MEHISILFFGALLCGLGFAHMMGNISSVHWYNRQRVSEENQKKFGKWIGGGTVTIGASFILSSLLLMIFENRLLLLIAGIGAIVGLIPIFYALIKYNKGIF